MRILSAALVCISSCWLLPAQSAPLRVNVVLSEHVGAYQEFAEALHQQLMSQSIALKIVDVDEKSEAADLIIAVGMKAANAVTSSNVPVLNVLVPKMGYDKLLKPATHRSGAIYLDQPIERQLALVVAALPKIKHIGVLYTAPPAELGNLRRLSAEKNLYLHEKAVGSEQILSEALDDVLGESEVLLVLPDTDIYNASTIRNILLTAYRKQVPLVGISQAYVRAGALCAIYSTPVQIATQAAGMLRQFIDSGKLPAAQYPKEFEVSVNMQVARSLALPIPDAEELRDEVRRAP